MKGKPAEEDNSHSKIDIVKNQLLSSLIMSSLRQLIKLENNHPGQFSNVLELASDMIKCIGLLAKVNFDRNIGVDSIYMKGYLPYTAHLVKIGLN